MLSVDFSCHQFSMISFNFVLKIITLNLILLDNLAEKFPIHFLDLNT